MTESVQDTLAALAELIDRFPVASPAGPVIGRPSPGGPSPQSRDGSAAGARWTELARHLPPLAGSRVLLIGETARAEADAVLAHDAAAVVVVDLAAAAGPESRNGDRPGSANGAGAHAASATANGATTGELEWEVLDAGSAEPFDIVHCDSVLHRCTDPLGLLRRLHGVCRPGGTLLLATPMVADPERSEYLRLIPPGRDESATWLVAGRLAMRWMLHLAGFDLREEFGEREGPAGPVAMVSACLRAVARP